MLSGSSTATSSVRSPFGIQITYAGGIVALATQIIVTLVTTRSGERSDSYQLYKEARKEMKAANCRRQTVSDRNHLLSLNQKGMDQRMKKHGGM